MSTFTLPSDLAFNTAPVTDPAALAAEKKAAGWLFLCGAEFAAMGGLAYDQVKAVIAHSTQVVSDPPRTLNLELARQHVAALEELPRPTLVTCRAGPRSSAVVYLYAGLKAGAATDDVLAAAERDGAPFTKFDDYKQWLRDSLEQLRKVTPPTRDQGS